MSIRFKRQIITLENYTTIFKECSPDVQDEIRSAILDDTQIAKFIEPCGKDSYKLGQIRMALRELLPVEFIDVRLTGKTIYYIRNGFKSGVEMTSILRYVGKLDPLVVEKLAEYMIAGVDIDRVDFTDVPTSQLDLVCRGLYKGYPMWLLVGEGVHLSDSMVRVLMRGMSLGIDVHRFIDGHWKEDVLLTLFSYEKSVDINAFIENITCQFDADLVRELLSIAESGDDYKRLCVRDTEGYPLYNRYQVYEIGLAMKEGLVSPQMFDSNLSDMDISEMREALKKKKYQV